VLGIELRVLSMPGNLTLPLSYIPKPPGDQLLDTFLAILGFELRALQLLGRYSTS
jgi:hypothetical protein